ncbi:MAG: glycoside hydrolase family 36 protein [Chloroflexota bacterium]
MHIENTGSRPIYLERLDFLKAGPIPHSRGWWGRLISRTLGQPGKIPHPGIIRPSPDPGELAFFSNGWQSWSFNGTYFQHDRNCNPQFGFLRYPNSTNPTTPRPKKAGHFISEMFAVLGDVNHRSGILVGFLSQKQHFGSIEVWLHSYLPTLHLWACGDHMRLDPGAKLETDWAYLSFIHLDGPDPLGSYINAVAREHDLKPTTMDRPVVGWCSWYHFYNTITSEDIYRNIEAAEGLRPEIHLDLIQIDDGYQARVGDWSDFTPSFQNGVAPLAAKMRTKGFTPGLWLAPFVVHRSSQVARAHPDWILRNRWKIPVNPGYIFGTFPMALDLTHPSALDYIRQVIHTAVHQWGFSYLKLDFLYTAALPGRRNDPTLTRAQALRKALYAIHETAGEDTTLLACGCPLGSAIGLFEAMRIGPDISDRWRPYFKPVPSFLLNADPGMPAMRNALRNTITRAALNRRWWLNDPDCLLLRPNTCLSPAEVQTWVTAVFLSGGVTVLSDDLPQLTPERLRLAQSLLPPLNTTPCLLDWLDNQHPSLLRLDLNGPTGTWHLIVIFNWEDKDIDVVYNLDVFQLPQLEYHSRNFWRGASCQISGGVLTLNAIPSHGVELLALRPVHPDQPQYIGSDLHLSQGREVTRWQPSKQNVLLELERPGHAQGVIELYLPKPPQSVSLNGQRINWEISHSGYYSIPVEFRDKARIIIHGTSNT